MSGRAAALTGTLAMIGLLGYLTINVMVRDGFTILVALSLFILALLGFGILGALIHPPDE